MDQRWAARRSDTPAAEPQRIAFEDCIQGEVKNTPAGQHFELRHCYPSHHRHGSADVGALSELAPELLDALSSGDIAACGPEQWAFLDTETTGLAGGSGTFAFLVGVGRITTKGFEVRQFFLRSPAEEASAFHALSECLRDFKVLVTYNGRAYDVPLLETRYRLQRERTPFGRMAHLDLLYGARRLWKLRLERCKLTHLEERILGFERQGDVPGQLIPQLYFEFLHGSSASTLMPVLQHNALDVLTLACLTAIVPAAFRSTEKASLATLGVRHGADLAGLARWLCAEDEWERARGLFLNAVDAGLPDKLMFRCLWDVSLIEKKLGHTAAAVCRWTDLAVCHNDFRVPALEELAKFYEHKEKNYALALEFTCEALRYGRNDSLENRKMRLETRGERRRSKKLPLY